MSNLKAKRFPSILLLLLSAVSTVSYAEKGCIALYQNYKPVVVEVELPKFTNGIFATKQFSFSNLPKNMSLDSQGRYCYDITDDRFAFVQTYYYAVDAIEDYNQVLTKLGLPLPKKLVWRLTSDPTSPTAGYTGTESGAIHYSAPAYVDSTTLLHEIGHWVTNSTFRVSTIQEKHSLLQHDGTIDDDDFINEGSADVLSMLHSGVTEIGKYDNYDNSDDLDEFVHYPDSLPTYRAIAIKTLNSPHFDAAYPDYVRIIQDMLNSSSPLLDQPCPYYVSHLANQVLWKASIKFGSEEVKLAYLKMLSELDPKHDYTYPEFIKAIIHSANEINPDMSEFLEKEYALRGIQ